jgi:succinate-semialdehyde dehydrogenase / glutarate-semialdehyde dehydrogenase
MKESLYINGKWVAPESGKTLKIDNPATGEIVREIGYGGKEDALKAVDAAHEAFAGWSAKTVYERAALLLRTAELIRENADGLARILTQEIGKPLGEARGEIGAGADQFEWYAEEVKRSAGDVIPNRLGNRRHLTIRHPVGPVAAISPWNFPILLSARKIAPALAAGCTVIARPASQASLTLLEVFKLIDSVGFPPGVANYVVGNPGQCSAVFLEDSRIKKISFTGSLDVGRELYVECAKRMKKVSLELGGHSPFVIMPDIDAAEAAERAVFAKFRNMGQVCISASRFYVPNAIKEQFEKIAVEHASKLRVGNGLDPDTDVGPLFLPKRVEETMRFVEDIKNKGGRILYGGHRPEGEKYSRGSFFMPTVASDITSDMLIMNEEPFCPILPIVGYDDIEEALTLANETPYGLAAYVLTRRLDWAITAAERIEAGMIGINDCSPAAAQCPFGGMKSSGSGREGWRQGLEAYYEVKYVSIGI